MIRSTWVLLLACGWLAVGATAAQEGVPRRVALVIGNGAYATGGAGLINPPNDARAMATKLEGFGFDVVTAIDQDFRGMRESLARFAGLLRGADVGLFYYAGHGMEYQGHNYLFPTDAELRSESDVYIRLMEVDQVLRVMETTVPVRLVFLDACRDNPLARSFRGALGATRSGSVGRGLVRVDAAVGTFIAYATAPGEVAEDGRGGNSPFTSAMLTHLEEPGLDIGELMRKVRQSVLESTNERQTPWESSSLVGSFVFNLNLNVTIEPPAATPAPEVTAQAEIVFWQSVETSRSSADYAAYLERFGDDGLFAPLAKARLTELTQEPERTAPVTTPPKAAALPATTGDIGDAVDLEMPAPATVEEALAWRAIDWQEIQAALAVTGFDPRGADGRAGPNTRQAVSAWQSAAGLPATGYLDESQRRRLLAEAGPRLAALEVARPPAAPPPSGVIADCGDCPQLVAVPPGSLRLGSPPGEPGRRVEEGPQRSVTIARGFAIGRFEVTVREWQACVRDGGCRPVADQAVPDQPVAGVSFADAGRYADWLTRKTGRRYALPSEAQWEYAARGATTTSYFWGASVGSGRAVCADCGTPYDFIGPAPVGRFAANGFGLHDTAGNVWEWVADCWNESHDGAPADGQARTDGNCRKRVLKGGSYSSRPHALRSAGRIGDFPDSEATRGLRVMRALD